MKPKIELKQTGFPGKGEAPISPYIIIIDTDSKYHIDHKYGKEIAIEGAILVIYGGFFTISGLL